MSNEEPIQMTAEQLWGLSNDEEIEKYRGEDVEITPYDHKLARDFKEFSKMELQTDNEIRIYDGKSRHDDDDDDDEFFDHVTITSERY